MNPPEKTPPPAPTKVRSNQVPWGSPKPAAKPPAPPTPAPPLSAKKVPWGSAKKPAPPPPSVDPLVTHMPWVEPEAPAQPAPPPPAPPPVVSAKRIPWSARKTPAPNPPPAAAAPSAPPPPVTKAWALPKRTAAELENAPVAQTEMEFARDLRRPEDTAGEPTAEQLVALLSRLTARKKEMAAPTPQTPYKARPISFEPSKWEIFGMWALLHRRRLGLAGVMLGLMLATAYLLKLVSLNAEIDRQWHPLEKALHDRYALVPAYVDCLETFTDNEHYTMALTERALTAWHKARNEEQLVRAAAALEQSLILLARAMKHQQQIVPAMDPDQLEASDQFDRLETQREQSRLVAIALVHHYNATVARYNDRVEGVPGLWFAGVAHLHPRELIFGGARE